MVGEGWRRRLLRDPNIPNTSITTPSSMQTSQVYTQWKTDNQDLYSKSTISNIKGKKEKKITTNWTKIEKMSDFILELELITFLRLSELVLKKFCHVKKVKRKETQQRNVKGECLGREYIGKILLLFYINNWIIWEIITLHNPLEL